MTTENTVNSEKITEKTVKVNLGIDFCKLPTETTSTTIEKTESNKLRTCDKLIVQFDRVNTKQVYGSKKEKIEANKAFIALIPKYLESLYNSKNADKDEDVIEETFSEWVYRIAFSKLNTITVMQRARANALAVENADLDTMLTSLSNQVENGKMDDNAIKMLEAMLAKAKGQQVAA